MDNDGSFKMIKLAGILGVAGLFCLARSRTLSRAQAEIDRQHRLAKLELELAMLKTDIREYKALRHETQVLGRRVDNLFAIRAKD